MGQIVSRMYGNSEPSVMEVVDALLPNKGANDLTSQLEELAKNMDPMSKQEKSLDAIDVITGRPMEKLIPRELLDAAPADWNFFPAANANKIIEMSESIRNYGLFHNITVWEKEDGRYMILGGHTRVACFDYLANNDEADSARWTQIPALVYKKDQITEVDARRIIVVSNIDQRELSISTKAKAYKEIYKLEKEQAFYGGGFNSRKAAAAQAGVSDSMFYRHLRLLELIPELQKEVDEDNIGPVVGYNISFLSDELQHYIYDKRIFAEMTPQAAAQLKDCKTIEEVEEKIQNIKQTTKYYKYTYQTRKQKTATEEVLPLIIKKDSRNEVADLYIEAVSQANLAADVKKQLIDYMNEAKI